MRILYCYRLIDAVYLIISYSFSIIYNLFLEIFGNIKKNFYICGEVGVSCVYL